MLDPQGMTLVFPTAFMNNPSSMFGHTLLRIDAKDQTRHKELVAFAINFAAEPQTQDNAALYAIKGLVGSYPGRFTVMPYYRKVREYNDIESRDIWEYKLKLNEQEVERILLHLWEMQRAEFDYYFLDENCSYQLLALLELARDDLQLINQFPLHAIPSDTVEALNNADLLERPAYRESFGTRLLHQANEIDPELFDAAVRAKQGEFPTDKQYSEDERAAILEFAYEWLNFELYDLGLERDPTAKRLTELLYQRSRIKVDSPFSEVPTPQISPEKGHASARAGLGYQYSDTYGSMMTFEGRIAYHDLLDSQQGFIPGAKISFLDTQLSVDEQGTSRLDRFYLIDAMALAPSNQVFDSLAWNARIGYDRMPNEGKLQSRWFGQGGYGKAWGDAESLHFYGLLSAEISGGELTDYDATIGGGVEAGLIYQIAQHHRIGMQGQYLALVDSDAEQNAKATASWHWQIDRNFALRSEVSYLHWGEEEVSGKLNAYLYF
ncbi:putative outermembrane protein [Vibrio ponticus]|nr:putative outermembrane protein [Vibrio ponticus]